MTWLVERRAVIDAQPELGLDAKSKKPVELRIAFEGDTTPTAEFVDPATNRSHPIELTAPRVTFVDAEPYTHVEIASAHETILSATLRITESSAKLLYARTGLLARLGIRGGRYPSPIFS